MKKDIEYLDMVMNLSKKELYNNYFCWLYPFTNENIKGYYDMLDFKDKSVLTVTSSGDHMLNTVLYGAKEVDCFDTNILSKYYVELKIAALKSLPLEEFLLFFNNKNILFTRKYFMNKNIYNKIKTNLNDKYRIFWDYVFNNYTSDKIYTSYLFSKDFTNLKELVKVNPYLQEYNYNKLKKILETIKINYHDLNFRELDNINKKFNVIILSNVPAFLDSIYKDPIYEIKKTIDNIKYKDSQIVLNYYYDNMLDNYIDDCSIYDFKKVDKEFKDYELNYIKSSLCDSRFSLFQRFDAVLIKKK